MTVKACSHITGGGFYENIPRMLPEGMKAVVKKDSYEVPAIFKLLAKEGDIAEEMMYNTFNMGLGMVVAVDKEDVDKTMEAIKAAGKLLNELGYVEEGYIDAMVKREETVTTYMGLGVAIPHGTGDAKKKVQKTGIVMLQYPEGVDFDGEKAQLVFGIAGIGDEHLGLLAKISEIIEDPERLEQLKTTENVDEIMEMFK